MQIPQVVKSLLGASRLIALTARCFLLLPFRATSPPRTDKAKPTRLLSSPGTPDSKHALKYFFLPRWDWAEFLCLKHLTLAWILQSEDDQTQRAYDPANTL